MQMHRWTHTHTQLLILIYCINLQATTGQDRFTGAAELIPKWCGVGVGWRQQQFPNEETILTFTLFSVLWIEEHYSMDHQRCWWFSWWHFGIVWSFTAHASCRPCLSPWASQAAVSCMWSGWAAATTSRVLGFPVRKTFIMTDLRIAARYKTNVMLPWSSIKWRGRVTFAIY